MSKLLLIFPAALAVFALTAHGHLMVAGQGTLNLVDGAAFMAVSVPVSAFVALDGDGDGEVSLIEFNRARAAVEDAVRSGLYLVDGDQRLELRGIMLSPDASHGGVAGPVSHLTVLGRFNIGQARGTLHFVSRLYGDEVAGQTLAMTVSRRSTAYRAESTLTPATPGMIFHPAGKGF